MTNTPTKPTVVEALTAVMNAVGAIGKTRKVEGAGDRGYKFRGIDEFLNAVHPALIAHGVVLMPEVLDREVRQFERTTAKGAAGMTTQVWLTMRFTFYGPAGDSLVAVTCGEGADVSDKATNKAMSAALKYALMQGLMIPLEDMADSDADPSEVEGSRGGRGRREPADDPGEYVEPDAVRERREKLLADVLASSESVQAQMRAWCKANGAALSKPLSARQVQAADEELDRLLIAEEERHVWAAV